MSKEWRTRLKALRPFLPEHRIVSFAELESMSRILKIRFVGWSPTSQMPSKYIHLKGE